MAAALVVVMRLLAVRTAAAPLVVVAFVSDELESAATATNFVVKSELLEETNGW